ncbi:RNA polymerase sigma factor [Streptomyces krungchingensis]|uniref:RNA polymerase sigma factor n=1 Tax=Streptomyces krungchingensis TaxID=1565034 RepID=UPI003CF0AC83
MTDRSDVEDLLRSLAPQVLGLLARRLGDFDACEDAVQEALIAAARHWPAHGVPENPRGWLLQTATRRYTDQMRSESARRRREERVAREPARPEAPAADDSLALLFMCCHPTLTPASAIALTLRAVGGLTTAQIAAAYLVPEATMAQRVSRAKQRLKASSVQFEVPAPGTPDWPGRLRSVLHVLYLLFNEGYTASMGPVLHRADLSGEAIRLARQAHRILPTEGEVAGLLALMLLTEARRPARTGPHGELIPLAEQDRTRWDRRLIQEGAALLIGTFANEGRPCEYRLLAAVAAVHNHAARAEDTDWPQIHGLYELLEHVTGSTLVTLNRAVALAMVDGPSAALALLDRLDTDDRGPLAGHHRVHAVRAHLLDMAGEPMSAVNHYRLAAALTTNTPERRYLTTKAAQLRQRAPVASRGGAPPSTAEDGCGSDAQ